MLAWIKTLTDSFGGRKAVAMLIVLAIVAGLLLACLTGWARVPENQLPLVDKALDLLKWSFMSFMAGNAVAGIGGSIAGKPGLDTTTLKLTSTEAHADPAVEPHMDRTTGT